jgi:hypothetical protein
MMMKKGNVKFSSAGSVQSVFRSMMSGSFLNGDWDTFRRQSKRQREIEQEMNDIDAGPISLRPVMHMFCSEFVALCFQEAIMSLFNKERAILRVMNLDPEAASPMALQGYLLNNEQIAQDWQKLGILNFNYC